MRMALLANPTVEMLDAPMRNAGLEGLLEAPLGTDRVRTYKPDPRAYQMALDAFGLERAEIVYVARFVGRRRREGVRLSILLGQPREPAGRGAGRHA